MNNMCMKNNLRNVINFNLNLFKDTVFSEVGIPEKDKWYPFLILIIAHSIKIRLTVNERNQWSVCWTSHTLVVTFINVKKPMFQFKALFSEH